MFTPTFIEAIIAAFEVAPRSVVHLDEVRSTSRAFYPFNFPTFEEFLASECPNWTGQTTKGLDRSNDMLHEANYGACLAARRDDIIRIGGADEHLDYLGYICGPYDLTFRLVNAGCRERWLTGEYLYHTWHPGESGINIDYCGPSDGRGMSSRSLDVRKSGVVEPGLENGAIRALRKNPQLDRALALAHLQSPADAEWRAEARLSPSDITPERVAKAFRGRCDVYFYRSGWYGVPTRESFDPAKAKSGLYPRRESREELERLIRHPPRRANPLRKIAGALYRRSTRLAWLFLKTVGFDFGKAADLDNPVHPDWDLPRTIREGYWNHNIVHFRDSYYGVAQSHGEFLPSLAGSDVESPYICGQSMPEIKRKIRAHMNVSRARRLKNSVRRVLSRFGAVPANPRCDSQNRRAA
jgi:hypothetical protein